MGTSGNPAVTHAYDAYGNRTSATDARGCTTSTTYDSSKTHPATITNCLGHVTNLEYDARWGAITSATDPNAQTTTSTYDVFGRLIKLTAPLDTGSTYGTVSYSYLDLGNPSAQRVQTSRTEQHGSANVLWSDHYLDGLGRTYLTRREGPGGQVILSDVTFDNRGLVSAVAAPHFSTETPVWTQFTYDSLGRLTSSRHPDNATATAAHSPGQVTLTDERGSVRRRFLDVWGRLTRVEEVNGADTAATTYTYDATGGLGRVTNHLGHPTTMTYDLLGRKVAMQDPNVGNLSYSYDLRGNLVSQTDAKGQTLTFTYDLLGRVLTKHYPGGAEILWTYDDPAVPYSKGRTTRVADLATISSFTYDPIARVTQVSRLLDGSTYTLGLVYDALGRVTSKTFPDGETVTYTFNDAGWLSAIPGYLSGITYNARGQQTQLQFANAVTSTRSYSSSRFWLETIATSAPSASHQNLTFTHDPAGNITQITDPLWTGSRTFSYDALNRLISASGPFGTSSGGVPTQTSETYLYDAIGNILQKAGIGYTYADPSHRAAVTSTSDGRAYAYDANGNMLSGAGRTLSWDPDNRLASVTMQAGGTSTFAYDHTGTRVRKTTESGVMRYPFAGYEVDHTGFITKHILAGDERVAVKRADGQTLFYHSDHLGGVNVITNQSGERVQLVEYDPWGKVTRQEGSADLTHRFTGEDFDPETGLLYFGGRYYDPTLARFTIPDPYIPRPSDPQAFNRYAYVRNNPVNRIDPSGYEDSADSDGAGCCGESSDSDDSPATPDATATISITISFSPSDPGPTSIGPDTSVGPATSMGPGTSTSAPDTGMGGSIGGGTGSPSGEDPGAGTRLAMAGVVGPAVRVAAPYVGPAARAAGAAIGAALGGLLGSAASNTGQQPGSAPSSSSDSTTSNKGDNPAVPHSTPATPDPNEPGKPPGNPTNIDPKFKAQLEKQLQKDGPASIKRSLRSLEQRLAEHEQKVTHLELKRSVEHEIGVFSRQIRTIQQFMIEKGIR